MRCLAVRVLSLLCVVTASAIAQNVTGSISGVARDPSASVVPDLTLERRWPAYVRQALKAGIHSLLSIGLPVHDDAGGALNLYARKPDAFDDEAVVLATTLSGYVAVALANAYAYHATAALARQMQDAMAHRAVIEQAKGIVMADRRCGPDEAFQVLSRLSQDTNRKLRDVACALVAQTIRPGP